MKIAVFSVYDFEIPYLQDANKDEHELVFVSKKLNQQTVESAKDCDVACLFSTDVASEAVIESLVENGIKFITTRSAGFNHIDLDSAEKYGIPVAHVPEYSPNAIAEHCVALILALQRKLIPSYERIRNYNFSLNGLIGTELDKKIVGVMGTGNIGERLIRILTAFGCEVLAYDVLENPKVSEIDGVAYVDLETLYTNSDVVSLNLPLNNETENIIDADALQKMKEGVILVNAGRGKLVDTQAVIEGLKNEKVGGFGMDVYEHEKEFFYEDHSNEVFKDDLFARLLTFKNVVVTAHQAFLTETALQEIADTTFKNIDAFVNNDELENEVKPKT